MKEKGSFLNLMKRHYHWIVAIAALLQLLIYGGAVNNFVSYHTIPVSEALGISRTEFSLSVSIKSVVGVVSTILSGQLIRKAGYRKAAALGLTTVSIAYFLFSSMQTYWMLLAGCVLVGLATGICATSGASRLINVWFHKHRGLILGLVSAATGVGSTLVGSIQAYAIDHISWRASFSSVAVLLLSAAVIVYLFVRNTPADVGLQPYGEQQTQRKKASAAQWAGFSMSFLKKRPAFYLMLLCSLLSCLLVFATQFNIVPYFQDQGMSATQASQFYGTMMLLLSVVKLSGGALCDKIGTKKVTLFCLAACSIGLILLMVLPQTGFLPMVALIVYSMALPLTTMIIPLLSLELFGYQSQAQYVGIFMSMTSAASILSGPLSNVVHDAVGSYRPVFWVAAAAALLLMLLYGLLYSLARCDRQALNSVTNEV